MARSDRACRPVGRLCAGVGAAGGAALISLATAGIANADDLDPVPVSDGPLYAAYLAGEQLEANEALIPHDLPVAYDSLYNAQLPIEQNAVAALSSTEALQLPNAANITGFDNLLVSGVDQYFVNSASDFSSAVTNFEGGDVTATTALNLLGDDFQLENATNYVNLLDDVFPFLGIGAAEPASADGVPVTVDPQTLLGEAGGDVTQANHVLNEIPAIGTPDETTLVNSQLDVQFQVDGLPLSGPDAPDVGGQLAELSSAESVISSYDGGALDGYVTPLFYNLDSSWLQASEAVLAADQALETAAADGASPIAAELAILSADFSLVSDAASALSIDWASSLF